MAAHTITLNVTEEAIYQKYLAAFLLTEEQITTRLKTILTEQVVQSINEKGLEKFKSISVTDKLKFID